MSDLATVVLAAIREESVGMFGGVLFFGSWILQALESRKAGCPIVSARFFAIRAAASALLAFEGLRTGSISLFTVMIATGLLMVYNLWLASKKDSDSD